MSGLEDLEIYDEIPFPPATVTAKPPAVSCLPVQNPHSRGNKKVLSTSRTAASQEDWLMPWADDHAFPEYASHSARHIQQHGNNSQKLSLGGTPAVCEDLLAPWAGAGAFQELGSPVQQHSSKSCNRSMGGMPAAHEDPPMPCADDPAFSQHHHDHRMEQFSKRSRTSKGSMPAACEDLMMSWVDEPAAFEHERIKRESQSWTSRPDRQIQHAAGRQIPASWAHVGVLTEHGKLKGENQSWSSHPACQTQHAAGPQVPEPLPDSRFAKEQGKSIGKSQSCASPPARQTQHAAGPRIPAPWHDDGQQEHRKLKGESLSWLRHSGRELQQHNDSLVLDSANPPQHHSGSQALASKKAPQPHSGSGSFISARPSQKLGRLHIPGPAGLLAMHGCGPVAAAAASSSGAAGDAALPSLGQPSSYGNDSNIFEAGSWIAALQQMGFQFFDACQFSWTAGSPHQPTASKIDRAVLYVCSLHITAEGNGYAKLKDPTGSATALVSDSVINSFPEFAAGASICLEQVPVKSIGCDKLLCIGTRNLCQVFPAGGDSLPSPWEDTPDV